MDHSHSPNKIIRERLRQARETVGLSQAEAASQLNKPQWFVSRCETGERRVDVAELVEFGKVYSKPLRYFLEELLD
jgi:ribosome-binding protein aMBF1 (putative translation factor)